MNNNNTPIKKPMESASLYSFNMKKCLNSNFNHVKQITVPFDELISISTAKKKAKGITHVKMLTELQNKLNYYKQILHFKESQFDDYVNEIKSFEKYFLSYFQKVSMFDIETFTKLKCDFEKIQMTFDDNIRNNAEKYEWEIFQSSTDNFFDYLKTSLNKIKEIDMKEITEDIICKSHNVDVEKEMMIRKQMKMIRGRKGRDGERHDNRRGMNLINEMSSAFLQRKRMFIKDNNNNDDGEGKGEDDKEEEEICDTTKKIFLKSFRQIYLIKEDGKVSHSEFGKENLDVYNKSKRSKGEWMRMSVYISNEEDDEDVYQLLDIITNHLFRKYTMMSKSFSSNTTIKLIIYGSCLKSERTIIQEIKTFLNRHIIKNDTVIKIDSYSHDKYSCLHDCIIKIKNDKRYNITTNIPLNQLTKYT